jgi:hypothetical protein
MTWDILLLFMIWLLGAYCGFLFGYKQANKERDQQIKKRLHSRSPWADH